ncbi:unnamed protein product [Closterium sp. Naga37s-1]|nr:unnamed protein product [Closterium sp. Naga37s-1]
MPLTPLLISSLSMLPAHGLSCDRPSVISAHLPPSYHPLGLVSSVQLLSSASPLLRPAPIRPSIAGTLNIHTQHAIHAGTFTWVAFFFLHLYSSLPSFVSASPPLCLTALFFSLTPAGSGSGIRLSHQCHVPGMLLDLLSPLVPSAFLPLLCLGSISRAITGTASGATRAALTQHFAKRQNAADISAKEGSQETAATMAGMLAGMVVGQLVAGNVVLLWAVFLSLTAFHVYANYRAVKSLCLTSLNRERVALLLLAYRGEQKQVLSPTAVSLQERLIPSLPQGSHGRAHMLMGHVHLGARLSDLHGKKLYSPFPTPLPIPTTRCLLYFLPCRASPSARRPLARDLAVRQAIRRYAKVDSKAAVGSTLSLLSTHIQPMLSCFLVRISFEFQPALMASAILKLSHPFNSRHHTLL